MKIAYLSSEVAPFAKTGGLADVLSALPRQMHELGHEVRVFVPHYDRIDQQKYTFQVVPGLEHLEVWLGIHRYVFAILEARAPGSNLPIHFVHCPPLYHRGSIYTNDGDEHRRFLLLTWAAFIACQRMGFQVDVFHCNDWQSALLPLTLKCRFSWDRLFAGSRTLLTIHNLMYQGAFPAGIVPDTNLSDSTHLFHQDQLRDGRLNFLLHGILYADGISTVSPTYAREIQTPELGAGLDPFLRMRSSTVVGVLNGVDYEEWSPDRDRHIEVQYDADTLDQKEINKANLLNELGLPYVRGAPLFGIVSRLAGQKGFDLLDGVIQPLLRRYPIQLVVLGSGEHRYELFFSRLQSEFRRQVCFYNGFSNPLAHMIEAGADAFLMPSRYEPCGLNQMYSLRYGTVPIVHQTGGLADTVQLWDPDTGRGTGLVFSHFDQAGLRWAIESAIQLYRQPRVWRRLQRNGMAQDFSWEHQAKVYELLYSRLGR